MEKVNKIYIKNKKEKNIADKKSILKTHSASILKFSVAIALLMILMTILVYAGDVIVENGKLDVDSKLFVNDAGNVGIGTTAPGKKLDVDGDIAIHMASTDGGLYFGDDNPVNEKWHIGYWEPSIAPPNGALIFTETGVADGILTLKAGGNVGIGTANPTDKLHVSGGNITLDNTYGIRIYRTGGATAYTIADVSSANVFRLGDVSETGWNTRISGAEITLRTAATDRIFIGGTGNVGIGTASPRARFDVGHTGTGSYEAIIGALVIPTQRATLDVMASHDTNAFQVWDDNDLTTPKFIVKRAGNVGIGTTSPSEKLDVAGDIKASGQLASQGGKVRRDFVTWSTSASSPLNIHIKTNIPIRSSIMYRILVEGYNYGESKAINSDAVGYTYNGWSCTGATQQNNYANGVSISQYCSGDGFVVIKLTAAASTYYLGFGASAWFVNPTGEAFDISGTVYQQDANL